MTPFHCTFKFFYPFVQTCEIRRNAFPISYKNKDPSPPQANCFASDTQNNIAGWAQNLENKLSDQMTKLTKSINKLAHDRHRHDTYDDGYDDRYHNSYDDRQDGHKPKK